MHKNYSKHDHLLLRIEKLFFFSRHKGKEQHNQNFTHKWETTADYMWCFFTSFFLNCKSSLRCTLFVQKGGLVVVNTVQHIQWRKKSPHFYWNNTTTDKTKNHTFVYNITFPATRHYCIMPSFFSITCTHQIFLNLYTSKYSTLKYVLTARMCAKKMHYISTWPNPCAAD